MSKTIAIRTHASTNVGIGHLARMLHLVSALRKYKVKCIFFVDRENAIVNNYLCNHEFVFLYDNKEIVQDEKSDAERFICSLYSIKIDGIIKDDYRFSEKWEKYVNERYSRLIVFDDRDTVRHACTVLVDGKWAGLTTYERYADKVNNDCLRLLGPDYILLDKKYSNKKKVFSGNANTILVSMGGGGDLAFVFKIVSILLSDSVCNSDIKIFVVVGPFSINSDAIKSLSKFDKRVVPIVGQHSLAEFIELCDLYIGAAGGTLYEVLALDIPALTFSLAENQYNNREHLEDLGHYFHFNNLGLDQVEDFCRLVSVLLENYERLRALYKQSKKINIDCAGGDRIAGIISGLVCSGDMAISKNLMPSLEFDDNNSYGDDLEYKITRIDDTHVNRYLKARNLESNLQKMTDVNKVNHLDHYIWWFTNERLSYSLSKNGIDLLYIWHQLKVIDGVSVLIGGWFPCVESCSSVEAIYALNWQLDYTGNIFKNVPWVAVINKSNKFVHALNKRFGFCLMNDSHHLYKVTKLAFPFAEEEKFNYYYRISQPG